jgi:GxxExxY protein
MTNLLNERVGAIAKDVYQQLGSCQSESVYQCALQVGLQDENIKYDSQRVVALSYKGFYVGEGYADLVVYLDDDKLVVELKAIQGELGEPEKQQLRNYRKVLDSEEGLLVNFPQPGKPKRQIEKSELEPAPKFTNVSLSEA